MEQLPTAQMENKHTIISILRDRYEKQKLDANVKKYMSKRMNYKHMFITTYIYKSNPFFSKNQGLKNKSWASC